MDAHTIARGLPTVSLLRSFLRRSLLVRLFLSSVFLLLLLAPQVVPVPARAAATKLFVANRAAGSNKITTANLNGMGGAYLTFVPAVSLDLPSGIALDMANGKIYITNATDLVKADLNGTNAVNLGNPGDPVPLLMFPLGIALDQVNNRLYVASYMNSRIVRVEADGGSPLDLGDLGGVVSDPAGIALDLPNDKMYITNHGVFSSVVRADLDGSNAVNLGNPSPGGLINAGGLALDLAQAKMYIAYRSPSNKIVRANLDGTGGVILPDPGGLLDDPTGIALDLQNRHLYVSSYNNNKVIRFGLDDGTTFDVGNLAPGNLAGPFGIALDIAGPDLIVRQTNDSPVSLGRVFKWTVSVRNVGTSAATFTDGQIILQDALPSDVTYGTLAFRKATSITGEGNLLCSVAANVLTCRARGGSVGLGPGKGGFDVELPTFATAVGTYTNPTGGTCTVDPGNVVAEAVENNNTALSNSVTVTAAVSPVQVYVANGSNGTISRADLNMIGGAAMPIGGLLDWPYGIALDMTNGKMYSVDGLNNIVVRANLDGSGAMSLGSVGGLLDYPYGIALDLLEGKMYITNAMHNNIIRADLDGSHPEDLGNLGPGGTLNGPRHLALDLANRKMYVTNASTSTISVANLSGTGGANLGNFGGTVVTPVGIALDLEHRQMYIANCGGGGAVVRANMDGTGTGESLGNLGNTTCKYSVALDLASSRMYVASHFTEQVLRADLSGGNLSASNFGGTLSGPTGIALDLGRPDLTAAITNDVSGSIEVGSTFHWIVTVSSQGTGSAVFAAGQTIFRDALPAGPRYGTPVVQNHLYAGPVPNISCAIASNILTCTAASGSVLLGPALGRFDVVVPVTPSSVGSLVNPAGGACSADHNGAVAESNETNNTCAANTVSVVNAHLRLPLVTR